MKYNCFIETGTASGETIFAVEPYFEKLYTIEFSEKYYNDTKNNYSGSKINFILGDSAIELKHLLPSITDKCIFFTLQNIHGRTFDNIKFHVLIIFNF